MSGQPIMRGYIWRLNVTFNAAVVPEGSTFRAEVRDHADNSLLTTLTTVGEQLNRVSDTELEIVIPASATTGSTTTCVTLDVVRTDGDDEEHLGFQLRVKVAEPITEPA